MFRSILNIELNYLIRTHEKKGGVKQASNKSIRLINMNWSSGKNTFSTNFKTKDKSINLGNNSKKIN